MKRNGNNLFEYVITLLFVGFALGYALWSINPDVFKNYFKSGFGNNTNETKETLTIPPLSE